jgi:hypothetical protein
VTARLPGTNHCRLCGSGCTLSPVLACRLYGRLLDSSSLVCPTAADAGGAARPSRHCPSGMTCSRAGCQHPHLIGLRWRPEFSSGPWLAAIAVCRPVAARSGSHHTLPSLRMNKAPFTYGTRQVTAGLCGYCMIGMIWYAMARNPSGPDLSRLPLSLSPDQFDPYHC